MPHILFAFILSVLAAAFAPNAIASSKPCADLLKAVNEAQNAYNKALGQWRQATVRVVQAEQEVKTINSKLKANDRAQIEAFRKVEAAKAEQAACEKSLKGDGPLAPLVDCSQEAAQVAKAEQALAALEATHKQLEDELAAKEQEVEDREDKAAAAHAAERAAAAALEKAKADAAGCQTTAGSFHSSPIFKCTAVAPQIPNCSPMRPPLRSSTS